LKALILLGTYKLYYISKLSNNINTNIVSGCTTTAGTTTWPGAVLPNSGGSVVTSWWAQADWEALCVVSGSFGVASHVVRLGSLRVLAPVQRPRQPAGLRFWPVGAAPGAPVRATDPSLRRRCSSPRKVLAFNCANMQF